MSGKIDWNQAYETVGGDQDLLVELIEIFFEEHPKLIAGIRESIDSNALVDLRRFAHTMKGCLRYFGETQAGHLSFELEAMARDNKAGQAEEVFTELKSKLEWLLPELRDFVASQPPATEA